MSVDENPTADAGVDELDGDAFLRELEDRRQPVNALIDGELGAEEFGSGSRR